MIDLSMLNQGQKEAVTYGEGPLLVLAGPGSGKTRVLTYRTTHLIERGEDPRSLLVTTFTKKAAKEMKDRLERLIGAETIKKLQIGTFHSFCLKVLIVECGLDVKDGVLQEGQRKRLFKDLLAPPSRNYPDAMNWSVDLSAAMGIISFAKNELLDAHDYEKQVEGGSQARFATLYKLYEKYKNAQGKIDFDDMLLLVYKLFKKEPTILAKYQSKFKWILFDEAQDNNLAQWEIAKMLAYPQNNITVVSDDDQSIYAFRGARPDNILSFHEIFRNAKRITLGENYRSTENIVRIATQLIEHNENRFRKTLKAMNGEGADPTVVVCDTPEEEAEFVINEIKALAKCGVRGGDIAVLYRTNAQSRAFEDELVKRDIPYVIIGSKGFYGRKEIKDIVSYLRVIRSTRDSEALERIINVPNRYLGKAFISNAYTHAYRSGITLFEAIQEIPTKVPSQHQNALEFCFGIEELQRLADDMTPMQLIREVRKRFRYDQWLIKEEGGDEADNNRIENLEELVSAACKFSNLPAFLDFVSKQQSKSNSDQTDPDKVQLMTIHRSKGLEREAIFLVGVSDGLLPHKNSMFFTDAGELMPGCVDEERRLCYVGITRAKRQLYISSPLTWQFNPTVPSMFLNEVGMSQEALEAVKAWG